MNAELDMNSPEYAASIIEEIYAKIRSGTLESVLWCFHPDFVFSSNAHPEKFGEVVAMVGTDHIIPYLERVRSVWDVDKSPGRPKLPVLDPGEPAERGHVFNVGVRVRMTHRVTGELFVGTKRQEWVIQNGKVAAMSQFLDRDVINVIHDLGRPRDGDAGGEPLR
jgi:ketosteroid isomerase-like protein